MALVQIPETDVWVNPAYVTSVRPRDISNGGPPVLHTEVEYEGNAGYRTRTTLTRASLAEVVAALNK